MICVLPFLTLSLFVLIDGQPGGKTAGNDTAGGDTGTGTLPDKVYCDIYGASSTYNEEISGDLRIITASGCPNHWSDCIGKPAIEGCTEDVDFTEALVLNLNLTIPATPCISDYVDSSAYNWTGYPVYCLLNTLGITLNGVAIFSPSANTECKDAIGAESVGFGTCGGHAGPTGLYHYHAAPACLLDQVNDSSTINPDGHSPQIGWALDGFPVYGPHGLDGEYIELCSANTSNSSDCLDNCSGHGQHTIDGFKYHYHVAGPVGDLETSPLYPVPSSNRWPYTFGCFRGIPSDWSQIAISGPPPDLNCVESGVTNEYVATPTNGITDIYVLESLDNDGGMSTTPESDATTSTTSTSSTSSTSVLDNGGAISLKANCLLWISLLLLVTIVAYQ